MGSPLHSFLFEYLNRLYIELIALQLEFAAESTLSTTCVTGRAGELVISDESLHRWATLLQLLEKHPSITAKCPPLSAAAQGLQLMNRLLLLHKKGNAQELMKYVDVLYYLNNLPHLSPVPATCGRNTPQSQINIFAEVSKILDVDDVEYQHLFHSNYANVVTGSRSVHGTSPPVDTMASAHTEEDPQQGAAGAQKSTLQKIFKAVTGNTLSSAVKLRSEIAESIGLLRRHATFELLCVEFSKCVDLTPACGKAGELDVDPVEYERLESLLERARAEGLSEQHWPWGAGFLLFQSTESLLDIRKGQKNRDEAMIKRGLERAKVAFANEEKYSLLPEATILFGQTIKAFISAASEETKLAEDDLQQRSIINALQQALSSGGLPVNGYPFDFSNVKLEGLEAALSGCDAIQPACEEAVQLFRTAKVILALRSLSLKGAWQDMIAYIAGLAGNDTSTPLVGPSISEYKAAMETVTNCNPKTVTSSNVTAIMTVIIYQRSFLQTS